MPLLELDFDIPGIPVAAPRPRAYTIQTPKGPSARMYTGHRHGGERIIVWRGSVSGAAVAAAEGLSLPVWGRDVPLGVLVELWLQRPLRHHRGHKRANEPRDDAPEWHITVPDADNLAKAVLDACSGILWHDDRQIADLHVRKRYADSIPGARVRVKPIAGEADAS